MPVSAGKQLEALNAIDRDYVFAGAWGTQALPGEFFSPRGIAFDGSGNIYVSDTQNNRIQKFSSNGTFIAECGSYGWDPGKFSEPHSITVNSSGNVLVVDSGNNRIRVLSPSLEFLSNFGSYGSGEGGFDWPLGIASTPDGSMLIADTNNHRIQILNSNGEFLSIIGSQGTGDGQFMYPNDVAVDDEGNIYVIDLGNNRVQTFFQNGTFRRRWGEAGDAAGQFNWPQAIAVDNNGTVYVADSGNSRIQVFSAEGDHIATWPWYSEEAGSSFLHPGAITVGPGGIIGIADSENHRVGIFSPLGILQLGFGIYSNGGDGEFTYPSGIAVAPDGGVLVVDNGNQRIQKFSPNGTFISKWGEYGSGDGQFANPFGITTDHTGLIFVTETDNFRVQTFSPDGTFNATWGGYGSGQGEFNTPRGIAVSTEGYVIVADSANNRMQVFTEPGEFINEFGSVGSGDLQFTSPTGVAAADDGTIYIADTSNSRIKHYFTNGTLIRTWGVWGEGDGQLNNPHGIAVSESGDVFVTDTYNDRICIFSSQGVFLDTFGQFGSANGSFLNPMGIAADRSGALYIADTYNHRVQKYVPLGKPLIADFSANSTFGRASLPVLFTDLSTGTPLTWNWNFGDGMTSTVQNPVHTYISDGLYTVSLTITNETTSDTETKNGYIAIIGERTTPFIVNHTSTNLSTIPLSAIERAKRSLHIAYAHTSHGSQLTDGMTGLIAFANAPYGGAVYRWNEGGVDGALDLHDYAMEGDLGNPDRISWANRTREYLATHQATNVIIWSWCGQVSDSTSDDIALYLSLMSELEREYPDVLFVYMTGHLDGTGVEGNLNQRNEQIRAYCRNNSKILYDFADIESYDPDGNGYLARYADDGCNYDGGAGNWAIEWQNNHTQGVDWFTCHAEHSEPLNGNLKAYAAWWLWSGLAGWSPEILRADFTTNTRIGAAPLPVRFTDLSTGLPNSWDWDFGDGNSSTMQNPTHTYRIPGTYTVNLTVRNDEGSDTMTREQYITVLSSGSTIRSGSLDLATGMNGTVPISVMNITQADGIYLNLTFNPALVNLTSITANASVATNTTIISVINITTGTASIQMRRSPETFDAGTDPLQVLDILFSAGQERGTGEIGLSDPEWGIDSGMYPFVVVQNGTMTIHRRADFNRNNHIDIGDVAKVAWMAAGLVGEDLEADFDGDGHVTGADAAKIAYFYVGKAGEL